MSQFLGTLARLTPPPVVVPEEYDGLEFRWKSLVFRPAYFTSEAALIGFIFFYLAWAYIGKNVNKQRVDAWVAAYTPLLTAQFSAPFVKGVTADGYTDFFTFSTGRRNIRALQTVFKLQPRHDLFQMFAEFAWGMVDMQYTPIDELELDFILDPASVPGDFVWAAVTKQELKDVKNGRWDLEFTKITDHPLVPATFSVMSEFADVTDAILKTNIASLLSDPAIGPYFRSISITDQPRVQPETVDAPKEKHLILSLIAPASKPEVLVNLVTGVFKMIDTLPKIALRPETKSKLRKAREGVEKNLKAEQEKLDKEQQEEDRRAAKKKAEEERVSKLSAAEQQKRLDKEKKRTMRKSQAKMVRK
ncbi:DUF1682-domain-containing protein [Cylindrobasidium torrendii FP15055 ss-10]|uniref:DUF1682-domain-containing protein n=1 Tax=Cylindrobasidium torrendii FP15055 ss-10 TaxID=1314674 RepID=A0A0D7BMK4_9AGAR|nr:DUF1682-domain-containing protein [Cylindrobasidium torrendii FP15055 ss-10]